MRCRVNGCTTEHRSDQLCCKRHWFKLPKAVRDRIWDLYRNGPEKEHREACFAALASLEVPSLITADDLNNKVRELHGYQLEMQRLGHAHVEQLIREAKLKLAIAADILSNNAQPEANA